jgi:hypothetical protein
MDIMNLLERARPGHLDPVPDPDRRAADLERAFEIPRPPTVRHRQRFAHPARLITIGTSVVALAGTAGVVVALSGSHPPATRTGPGPAGPAGIRGAILTAMNDVSGDVFYTEITETLSGSDARYDGVEANWTYPLQAQAGQRVRARSLVLSPSQQVRSDTEWFFTQPAGSGEQLTKTEMIDVQYGNRTWSDTTSQWGFGSAEANFNSLRQAIINGTFGTPRTTVLNGQTVLEVSSRQDIPGAESVTTFWVDPGSYLPVRMLARNPGMTYQVDYAFLPPTAANIARLKVTVPAGFTKTPTQKLP